VTDALAFHDFSHVTIRVTDMDRSLVFYRDGLGLPTAGVVGQEFEHGAVVFVDLQQGLRLALFPRPNLAHDAGIAVSARSASEFTLGHNVASEREVDEVMAQAAMTPDGREGMRSFVEKRPPRYRGR